MSFRFSRSLVAVFVLALSVVYSVVMVASAQDDGFDDAVNGNPDFNSDVASSSSFKVYVNDVVVDEGAGLAHFTISHDGTNTAFTVYVSTSDFTATAPDDYTAFSQTLSFTAGETSKTVSIPIIPDDIPELSETFIIRIEPSVITIWDVWGKGTIVDDDNLGEFSINNVRVKEDTATATFTVSRSGKTDGSVSVDVATVDGSAKAGQDYTALIRTLHFGPNEATKPVTIMIHPDDVVEPNETFFVELSNPLSGAVIDDKQGVGVGTIVNDDTQSEFSINDVSVKEDIGTATFTITRRGRTDNIVSVNVFTIDKTAKAGQDYTTLNTTLHFGPNEATKPVTVTIHPDDVFEEDETFYVKLSNPSAGIIRDAQGVGTIVNDDTQSEFSINDVSVKEDAATATFTITRRGRTDNIVSVDVATVNDTAEADEDYTTLNTTLHFGPNEATKPVTVTIHPDDVFEEDETFYVKLSNPSAGIIRDDWGKGTIVNDDTQSEFSINDVSVKEDAATATFTITRRGRTDNIVSVDVATADYTAKAGQDYVGLTTTTLHFRANETTKPVAVTIHPDDVFEPDETFYVKLSNPSAGIIWNIWGKGTIVDDDNLGEFSINDVSVKEDAATAIFTVTRGGKTDSSVSVDVSTTDGTARAGEDYAPLNTTLHFGPNETTKPVAVTIHPDHMFEPDETFYVKLSNPSAGIIWNIWGKGTIVDDDNLGEFSINDVSVKEDAATAIFTVTRGGKTDSSVSVDVFTTDGTARAGEDYTALNMTLYFGANEMTKSVAVTIHPDDVVEPDETFVVRLSNPSVDIVWDVKGEGTIVNDDELPPREDSAPHAPQDIKVYRRQGQPLIQWRDDVNAQWYNFVIFGEPGNPTLHNLWYSKPGVPLTTADYAQVKCNEGICLLDLPETKPFIGGGQYGLWMRAWGTPDGTFASGLMSKGGTAQYKGVMYEAYNATSFSLPNGRPQQPDPKGITVTTNADTGQPTIGWQAADNVIWYQVWIGSQINGTYVAYHLQDWTYAGDLGCIDPKSQCTFSLPSPLSNGTSRLPAGTYEVWLNSWGPAGFAVSSIPDVPNHQGWVKLTELTVGS